MVTQTQYVGKHRTRSSVDLASPRIVAENIAAIMVSDRELYVCAVDADTHNLLGIDFGPDATAALRNALEVTS